MIELPATAVADITSYLGTIFGDLWIVIALIIGLPLGFYVINKVISMFTKRTK